jgi:hypothetical protein
LINTFDPALLTGWGVRASDWTLGAAVQQQILPRASIEVAYTRRWFNGFTVYDNQLAAASDFAEYSISAPSDPRLPGGGGYAVSGLYDIAPSLFGRVSNLVTEAKKYGKWTDNFNGVDVTMNVRTGGGWTFQGGTSTGQTAADNCEARNNLPEPWSHDLPRQSDESVLPRRLRLVDAITGALVVPDSENRCPAQRRLPEQARGAPGGELRCSKPGHRSDSGSRPCRQPGQRHDQPRRVQELDRDVGNVASRDPAIGCPRGV